MLLQKTGNKKAQGEKLHKVNVISQRNGYVLEVIRSRSENIKTLDVGCGTGELVHDIARMGNTCSWVDFANNEMIKEVDEVAKKTFQLQISYRFYFLNFYCRWITGCYFCKTVSLSISPTNSSILSWPIHTNNCVRTDLWYSVPATGCLISSMNQYTRMRSTAATRKTYPDP